MNYEYLVARITRRRHLSVSQFRALHLRLCGYLPPPCWEGESGAESYGWRGFPGVEVFFDADGYCDFVYFYNEP